MERKKRGKLLYIAVVVLVLMASVFLAFKLDGEIKFIQGYGLIGLFFMALLVNASILFPVPIFLFPFAVELADTFNPFLVSVIYAFGATIGESVAYGVGFTGTKVFDRVLDRNSKSYRKAMVRLKRGGFWKKNIAIFFLAMMPIFPFDLAGLAAGVLRYPFWQFFGFCLAGRIIKYSIVIMGGAEIWNIFRS